MQIVYYTRPSFLDPALSLIHELSLRRELKVHLLLELSPESWQSGLFDVPPSTLESGILPAMPFLGDFFPLGVQAYWQHTKSFNLVVHNCPRSIHPSTWWTSRRAISFIRSLKPDILHLDDVSLRLAGALPLLGDIPIVLNIHDSEPHSGEKNWRDELARTLTFKRVKRFILHNKALQESFCARYHLPRTCVETAPLGVYTIFREWMEGEVPEAERTVLFFGRLSKYKGLEDLYEAAPLVAKEVPGVRFIVAGRAVRGYQPPLPPVLANGGQIQVLERYISNAELAQLVQRATVVVCPYTDATQSGVVLTAYAFGKPVVATRVGGLPEYVRHGETGYLTTARDPVELAQAINRLLENPLERQRLKQNILLETQTKLSWKMMAAQMSGVYKQIAGQGKCY